MRRGSTLDYEHTLMYGRYSEDLSKFARSQARQLKKLEDKENLSKISSSKYEPVWKRKLRVFWKNTFARIGEDWVFLALLGVIMAILSFIINIVAELASSSRLRLYHDLTGNSRILKYVVWVLTSMVMVMFSSGFVHIVAPQAVGSGIPEMKVILRGVVLKEYLTFRTLVAKVVGLTFTLGSGLPLGREGPFVHISSIVATLLSRLVTSFKGIYENESRTCEMLAAACAVGVAATFFAPIGGVLFSIEVTSVYFAVRNYWRGFFAACCGATVWKLLTVWIKNDSISALFRTSFKSDFPFDPQELVVFALIGVVCGFAGAGYVALHRKIVRFNRQHKKLNRFLQSNRFIYPALITFIITSCTFPPLLGKYFASSVSTHKLLDQFFSNLTWGTEDPDFATQAILKDWTTNHTNHYFHLILYILMSWWMSTLASTIPVPSGLFTPVFKMGAAFGRLVGEIMAFFCPEGIPFGGGNIAIVPGGYAVVGAAAFSGAVTHTISTTVMVFELTGQMSHIIPVTMAVLIANAVAQSLKPSIYDSIIEIKKLPYLPQIVSTSSTAHNILVDDIMIRDVVFIWNNCTYKDIKVVLKNHPKIETFPLVESPTTMILLGSIQRHELKVILSKQCCREKRLQEVQRRYSQQDTIRFSTIPIDKGSKDSLNEIDKLSRRPSRFEVTLINQAETGQIKSLSPPPSPNLSPKTPVKSILKPTVSITYSSHSPICHDFKLRQAFENIFMKSLKLQDANGKGNSTKTSSSAPNTPTIQRRVQLPKERVIDMSPEEQLAWEEDQLEAQVDLAFCQIDPAPFQLVEKTSLYKVHSLFSMLQLNQAYVTSIGRLVGVVALKDIRTAIERMHNGTLVAHSQTKSTFNTSESDPQYTDTLTSNTTNDSEPTDDSNNTKVVNI